MHMCTYMYACAFFLLNRPLTYLDLFTLDAWGHYLSHAVPQHGNRRGFGLLSQ